MGLAYSLVARGVADIDPFADLTIDKAEFGGHVYADKAPGLSFTALPPVVAAVAAVRALHVAPPLVKGDRPARFFSFLIALGCFCTNGLFTALAAVMLYRLARHWGAPPDAALFAALVFGIATPAAGWASVFFGHALAGACLVIAFAAIVLASDAEADARRDLLGGLAAGLVLAWAVVVEFTAAPAAAAIALFGLWRLRAVAAERRLALGGGAVLGGIAAAVPLLVYNHLVFGAAFHLGYENVVGFTGMKQGLFGVSMPRMDVLWELVFGGYRGILWVAPVLIAVPLGYLAAARALPRAALVLLLAVPALYFLVNSGYYYWDGGHSTGPRHVSPAVAFLVLPLAWAWARAGAAGRAALLVLATASAMVTLLCASVDMFADRAFPNPLLDYIIPAFLAGDTYNALTSIGIRGWPSLLGLVALWLVAALAARRHWTSVSIAR